MAVQEPVVRYTAALGWEMWYTGGWSAPATGYATSSDGLAWTKYASNPVFGKGGSGYAGGSNCPEIIVVGGTYYLYATDNDVPVVNVATSADGIAWTIQASSITLPAGKTVWGNHVVWIEGAVWKMLQEAGSSPWETYLYTSSDGLTWTIGNSGNALTTLRVAVGGMYGGPTFATDLHGDKTPKFGGLYHLWYHATPGSGNLPTNIYHATSPDLITWTQVSPSPVLTYAGSGFEVDQVADPSIVVVGGTASMFYDGENNPASAGRIGLATRASLL